MSSVTLNRLRIAMAVVLMGLTLTATRGMPWPTWATPAELGWLALSGLVGFVFGDTFYFRALVILGPGRAALLQSMAPVFTALLGWLLLHEIPGRLAVLGMALTLGGITWVVLERQHGKPQHIEGSIAVGIMAGVLGAIGQAGGFVLSKFALRSGIDPLSATMVRATTAMVAMWAFAAIRRELRTPLAALADRRAAALVTGGALFGPFLGVALSLAALQRIPAGVAASIIAFNPVFTMLISARFFGERLSWRTLAGATVAVAGVVVLFLR